MKTCCGFTIKNDVCKKRVNDNEKYCNLHKYKYRLEKPEECAVCFESLESVHNPLQCGHYIHPECIIKSKKSICPICRADVKLYGKDYQQMLNNLKEDDNILQQHFFDVIQAIHIYDVLIHLDEYTSYVYMNENEVITYTTENVI